MPETLVKIECRVSHNETTKLPGPECKFAAFVDCTSSLRPSVFGQDQLGLGLGLI